MSEKYTLTVSFEQRVQIIKVLETAVEKASEEFICDLKYSSLEDMPRNEALHELKQLLDVQQTCLGYKFQEVVEEEEE